MNKDAAWSITLEIPPSLLRLGKPATPVVSLISTVRRDMASGLHWWHSLVSGTNYLTGDLGTSEAANAITAKTCQKSANLRQVRGDSPLADMTKVKRPGLNFYALPPTFCSHSFQGCDLGVQLAKELWAKLWYCSRLMCFETSLYNSVDALDGIWEAQGYQAHSYWK